MIGQSQYLINPSSACVLTIYIIAPSPELKTTISSMMCEPQKFELAVADVIRSRDS
jgi:hypothetical protein